MRRRAEAEWVVFKSAQMSRLRRLERCLDSSALGSLRIVFVKLKSATTEMAAAMGAAEERAKKQSESRLMAQLALAGLQPADAELLLSMPTCSQNGVAVRYCPRAQTERGCASPLCPLAHHQVPPELLSWKFRYWAYDAGHGGWVGELDRARLGSESHVADRRNAQDHAAATTGTSTPVPRLQVARPQADASHYGIRTRRR